MRVKRRTVSTLLLLLGVVLIVLATSEALAGVAAVLWIGAAVLFLTALALELSRR